MEIKRIPFSPPDISDLEIEEMIKTLKSGWITTGPKTKQLEKNIAAFVGTEKCVCLSSQTICTEMALRLLGIGADDEVITCAYTYTASASVIAHVGAKIVLVDTQKDSVQMDYAALERAITEKTKAIIPIDLAGIPCDYDKIYEIVRQKQHLFRANSKLQAAIGRIAVVADTAHALGAVWKDRQVGSIADFSSFSFHAVKNLTTAEGGALTWKSIPGISDEDIYKELQLYSLHGQSKDALEKNQLGAWEYDIVGLYYKCNMTDICASIGLQQLVRYADMLARRKEIIQKYDAAFRPLGIVTLEHYQPMWTSSGHLYITRIPNATIEQRNAIIWKMAEEGVACNVHYKPLPMHTAYKNLGFSIQDYPNAYNFFANEITLPLHTCLTNEDVDYVIEKYTKVLKEYMRL